MRDLVIVLPLVALLSPAPSPADVLASPEPAAAAKPAAATRSVTGTGRGHDRRRGSGGDGDPPAQRGGRAHDAERRGRPVRVRQRRPRPGSRHGPGRPLHARHAGAGRPPLGPAARARAAALHRPGHGAGAEPRGPAGHERHAHGHAAARRAAVRECRDPGPGRGPEDAGHRRRGALHAGCRHRAGRRQSRHADLPRQQLHLGLLRRRHPRRRPVLPRPLQRRARRGLEGPERHDLRARRRGRRDQPREPAGRLAAVTRARAAARLVAGPPRDRRPRAGGEPQAGAAGDRRVREVRLVPRGRGPRALRREPDRSRRARPPHHAARRLRVLPRRPHGRSRDPVVRGPALRDGCQHVLRQPGRELLEDHRERLLGARRAPLLQPLHAAQPHELRRLRQVLPERVPGGRERGGHAR